jgi:ABC-type uncharacterized transport system substrate-binding protein
MARVLKEVVPGLSAAGLMYNPATATYFEYYRKPFLTAAQAADVRPFSLEVGSIGEIEQAFRARAPGEGIVAMSDPFLTVNSALIRQMELQFRVPVVSGVSTGGSLISYAPNTEDLFRRSGAYVDRILRGESPADLPVQLPSKFDLIVNMKTAAALGLRMPQTILAEADDVIE